MLENTTKIVPVSPGYSGAQFSSLFALNFIELTSHLLLGLPCSALNFFLICRTSILHPNLKVILLCQSVCIFVRGIGKPVILKFISIIKKLLIPYLHSYMTIFFIWITKTEIIFEHSILFKFNRVYFFKPIIHSGRTILIVGARFSQQNDIATNGPLAVIMLYLLPLFIRNFIIHVLVIERVMATWRPSTYEKRRDTGFHIVWFTVVVSQHNIYEEFRVFHVRPNKIFTGS
jgi:hypothetical protein